MIQLSHSEAESWVSRCAGSLSHTMDRKAARTPGVPRTNTELWRPVDIQVLCEWACTWLSGGFRPAYLIYVHDSVSLQRDGSAFLTPHLLASLGVPLSPFNPDAVLAASYESTALPSLLLCMIIDNWEFSVFSSEGRQRAFRHDRDDMVWVESSFPEAIEEARPVFEELEQRVTRRFTDNP